MEHLDHPLFQIFNLSEGIPQSLVDRIALTINYENQVVEGRANEKQKLAAFEGVKEQLYFDYSLAYARYLYEREETWKELEESVQIQLNAVLNFLSQRYASFSIKSVPTFLRPMLCKYINDVSGNAHPFTRLVYISVKTMVSLPHQAQSFAILAHELTHATGYSSVIYDDSSSQKYKNISSGWLRFNPTKDEHLFHLFEEMTVVSNENAFLHQFGWQKFKVFTNRIIDCKIFPSEACFIEFSDLAATLYDEKKPLPAFFSTGFLLTQSFTCFRKKL